MGAQAIALAGHHALDPHVPDIAIAIQEHQPRHFLAAVVRKEAKLDQMGIGRKDREVDAAHVNRRTHRPRTTGGLQHARRAARQGRALRCHPVISA
jgi:hypothetical protein